MVNKIWKMKNEQKYTTNKYTINIIWKMKNEQNYTNIYETESMQKHYLNYYIRKLRLGERRSI